MSHSWGIPLLFELHCFLIYLGRNEKKDIDRARLVMEENPNLNKVRMPEMDRFKSSGLVVSMGMRNQILFSIMGAIGIMVLIGGLGVGEKAYVIPSIGISTLFLLPVVIYFIWIFRSSKKLGGGRYPVNTNFFYFDESGIFFTRHLDMGNMAIFLPWDHVKVVNYSKAWKSICIVPDVEFKVTQKNCEPKKIECVMLNLNVKQIKDLVIAIYEHNIPVMRGEKAVFRSDIVKFHSP